jgi:hypothetical protein
MAGHGRQQEGIVRLLGRDAECADIDRLLDDARAGAGAALVVRGEPGIGKSALLDYARRRAASMTLLSAAGVQAESDLAFAGLHGLLRPVLAQLRQLPQPQSAALAGALGLAPSRQADRLLISAAVLGLLAAAAEDGPVLCVVDDAHWMDRPSADALVFAARRLQAERLAMVFAAREGEVERFEAAGLPDLTLAGLDPPSATAVLAAGGHAAAGEVRERLLAEAGGNPLALLELPHGLSQAQLDGRATLPDAIPLSPRLEGVFRQRIGRLPVTAQTALLIAAADTTGDVPAVLRAMAGLGLPPDTLDPAEGAALVRIPGMTITFRHPLVRSAVYQGATMSQRRAHQARAAVHPVPAHGRRPPHHSQPDRQRRGGPARSPRPARRAAGRSAAASRRDRRAHPLHRPGPARHLPGDNRAGDPRRSADPRARAGAGVPGGGQPRPGPVPGPRRP